MTLYQHKFSCKVLDCFFFWLTRKIVDNTHRKQANRTTNISDCIYQQPFSFKVIGIRPMAPVQNGAPFGDL